MSDKLDELLEKKLCILCHENPWEIGVICGPCRNDRGRAERIIEKKLNRIQAEKIEKIHDDFRKGNCIKCHVNPSLETMPYCTECAKTITFDKNK